VLTGCMFGFSLLKAFYSVRWDATDCNWMGDRHIPTSPPAMKTRRSARVRFSPEAPVSQVQL